MDNERYNDNLNESAASEPQEMQQEMHQEVSQNPPKFNTSYGEYAYKRPESAQQTSYVRPEAQQSFHTSYASYTQHNPYAYNPYAQQQNTAEKEMKSFKKKMYGLLAGFCALALVLGVAGGGLVGYGIANRNQPAVQTTQASAQTTAAIFENNSNPVQRPPMTTAAAIVPPLGQYEAPNYLTVPSDASAMPVQEVYQKNVDAVVSIYVEKTVMESGYYYYGQNQSYTKKGAGSGVILSADGFIATNNHVIADANKIRVCLQDGREFEATLVGTDEDTDVALIKIEAENLVVAPVGDSDSLMVGDQAIVIGNPLGRLSGTLTVGYVSALNREMIMDDVSGQTMGVIQTDAAINPGNSGGAMFNAKGELVGIVFAKTSNTQVEGLGYAIPINKAVKVIDDLVEHGYVTGRPAFGIDVVTVSDQMTAMMYRVNYLGVYVANSYNPENGLVSGDLIISINGKEIGDYATLSAAIRALSVGDTATVEIMRGGEKMTLQVPVIESVPTVLPAE